MSKGQVLASLLLSAWAAGAVEAAQPTKGHSTLPLVPGIGKSSEPKFCAGEYAEDFTVLSPKVRAFEALPQAQYTFAARNTATYECVSYGQDGSLRRVKRKATSHGTVFAYRQQNGETYLLTNQHVAEFPAVTDEEHTAGDVPHGCKRISENLRIVDNESDAYERDDIPLTRVVSDVQLDVAILKARAELPVMPWKTGKSAALHERDVVDVRGFPLGAFKATNMGKVVSAYDHDDDKEWNHDDFVIDALLSPGNSGSPVLAVSCKTGEFELVGIYHAGYTRGSALNVVVGIDQVRDLMTTFKRTPRERAEPSSNDLDRKARLELAQTLPPYVQPFFPFGSLPALVRPREDGALLFEVMSRDFPVRAFPILVIEDLPSGDEEEFGSLGRVWMGSRYGLKAYERSELDAESQAQILRILEALRRDASSAFAYRTASRSPVRSREEFDRISRMERAIRRTAVQRQDLAAAAVDMADRLSPHGADGIATLSEVYDVPHKPTVAKAPPLGTAVMNDESPAGVVAQPAQGNEGEKAFP